MAINKVEYGDDVLIDLTEDTVTSDDMLSGVTAHDASGRKITGSVITHNVIDNLESESVVDALSAHQGKVLYTTRMATDMENIDEAGIQKVKDIAGSVMPNVGNELNVEDNKINYKANFGTKDEFEEFKQRDDIPIGATYRITDDVDDGFNIIDNLDSDSGVDALSARQGKVLNQKTSDLIEDLTKELNFAIDNKYIAENIFSGIESGSFNINGEDVEMADRARNIGKTTVVGGTNYIIKFDALGGKTIKCALNFFNASGTKLLDSGWQNSGYSVDAPSGTSFIRIIFKTSADDSNPKQYISNIVFTENIPSNADLKESFSQLTPQAYSTSGLIYNNCSYLSGGYVKIGNLVVVNLRISADGSSTLQIKNLPSYTNKSSLNCVAVSIFDTVDHNNQVFGYMASGGVLRAESVSGAHAHLISVVYLCD